jgi:hypothetical protein
MSKNKKYKALFNAMDNNAELETIPFDTIAKAVKNCSTVTTTEKTKEEVIKKAREVNNNTWITLIKKHLLGRKIVDVQYMSEEDAEYQGWDRQPIQIKLDNGTWLTPSMDDEGNDGGSIETNLKDMPTIPSMY